MNHQWRSQPGGPTAYCDSYCDNTSTLSPLTTSIRFQDAVPSGTVASRVQYLQSLTDSSYRVSAPLPNRRRENSRTGFGRRLTNRFGRPALQSTNPDEQPQFDTAHSFLGLTTPRMSHAEEHASADQRGRYNWSRKVHGRSASQGIAEEAPREVVTPWGSLSRSKSSRSMGRRCTTPDVSISKEISQSGKQTPFLPDTSVLPGEGRDPDTYRQKTYSDQGAVMKSETSCTTTSATERQMVRDLFDDYGIKRPPGLASSGEGSRELDDTPRPTNSHKICHSCSWVNASHFSNCWRCHHKFCLRCDDLVLLPDKRLEAGSQKIKDKPKPKLSPKKLRGIGQEPVQQSQIRINPTSAKSLKVEPTSQRNGPERSIPFPSFYDPSSIPLKKQNLQVVSAHDQPSLIPLSGSQSVQSVKDSPFLVADLRTTGQPPPALSYDSVAKNNSDQRSQNNGQLEPQPSSSFSRANCDGPTYCTTYHGYQSCRPSSYCSTKKRPQSGSETDNGITAGTSWTGETARVCSHSRPSPSVPHSEAGPHSSRTSPRLTCTLLSDSCSSSPIMATGVTYKHSIPEFVECHGYPRTGHDLHGSPVSSGIIGECQHCLDDCQCQACQNTLHNVRCCVHEGHSAIPHHHHTPRRELSEQNIENIMSTQENRALSPSHSCTVLPLDLSRTSHSNMTKYMEPLLFQHGNFSTVALGEGQGNSNPKKQEMAGRSLTPTTCISMPRKATKSATTTLRNQDSRHNARPASSIPRFLEPPPHTLYDGFSPDTSDQMAKIANKKVGHPCITSHQQRDHPSPYRESSVSKESPLRPQSAAPSLSLSQVSPPGSRRASRRLSALFQLRDKNTVSLLNQKLLDHQEELRKTQRDCDEKIMFIKEGSIEDMTPNLGLKKIKRTDSFENEEQHRSSAGRKKDKKEKKQMKLRIVDKKQNPLYGNDGSNPAEHRLYDGEVVAVERGSSMTDDSHTCVWKSWFLEIQRGNWTGDTELGNGSLGMKGITIVFQLEGREDLIATADSWTGGEVKKEDGG